MLKSKQSRLAKKMKHAKLSTKYFYPKSGCVAFRPTVGGMGGAVELSRLERDFVNSIPDPVERSEVKFHMSSQWREHFASRAASLGVVFDGRRWLGSVEDMERRLAFETERHRLVKRRFMMGKAMEKDCDSQGKALEQGVFVRTMSQEQGQDEFELVVEKSVSNSAGSMGHANGAPAPPFVNLGGMKEKESSSSQWSSNEPNFKHAAPFLAGIASYIERNAVPFEHVDVWVPSFAENPTVTEGSGSPGASDKSLEGSNASAPGNFRLCFGGSVTMGVQIVYSTSSSTNSSDSRSTSLKRLPISPESKSALSLFGMYSEKFSFSSNCGLPGRIFHSGVPAWEQFVSEAPANQFERRGGALQFGVKTAVGLPIDSPNVGRVVLVMYSKYDRAKDERLVGRMMCDLKLLCPSPRWKLVVDVDSPLGCGTGIPATNKQGVGHVTKKTSSLEAPPPVNTTGVQGVISPSNSPTPPSSSTFSRAVSVGSGSTKAAPSIADNAHTTKAMSHKDKQIADLLLLLASNIPSSLSPSDSPLAAHLQSIMSLRLILLRGKSRTPEEEALVDTTLVLYESYLHAGRSMGDIAVMVARDFTFHLGHQRESGLAIRYGGGCATAQLQQQTSNNCQFKGPHQGPPPSMYTVAQVQQGQAPSQMPNMGNSPQMGSIPDYKTTGGPAPSPILADMRSRAPLMNDSLGHSPLLNGFNARIHQPRAPSMGSSPLMGPIGNYNPHCAQPQQQNLTSPTMMGTNFNTGFPATQQVQHPRTQYMPFLTTHNSSSPRSTGSLPSRSPDHPTTAGASEISFKNFVPPF